MLTLLLFADASCSQSPQSALLNALEHSSSVYRSVRCELSKVANLALPGQLLSDGEDPVDRYEKAVGRLHECIRRLVRGIASVNLESSPTEFQVAYREYVASWANVLDKLDQPSIDECERLEFIRGTFGIESGNEGVEGICVSPVGREKGRESRFRIAKASAHVEKSIRWKYKVPDRLMHFGDPGSPTDPNGIVLLCGYRDGSVLIEGVPTAKEQIEDVLILQGFSKGTLHLWGDDLLPTDQFVPVTEIALSLDYRHVALFSERPKGCNR